MSYHSDQQYNRIAQRIMDYITARPEQDKFDVQLSRRTAMLFVDFLRWQDPDMPPAPLCKALGPLVGDLMVNSKLQRLEAMIEKVETIADGLGTMIIYDATYFPVKKTVDNDMAMD